MANSTEWTASSSSREAAPAFHREASPSFSREAAAACSLGREPQVCTDNRTKPRSGDSNFESHDASVCCRRFAAKRVTRPIAKLFRDFDRDEDGKLTLVATVMMLAMIVLIGLVGNAGHAVNQKLEVQNAADAASFSSTLWMSRGMNSVTATNHMIGEATALCAVHEALGGPGADLRLKQNTTENRILDGIIDGTKVTAPIGPGPFVLPPLTAIDKRIIDFVVNRTTPRQTSKRDFEAFATIFDSKMTLKRELSTLLITKSLADLGFYAPWPFNMATIPAAYAVHIYATSQIVLIGKEWVILDVVEKVAKAFTKLKLDVIEAQLVPTLTAHADFVGSYDSETGEFEEGILNRAVERTLEELRERHDVELAIFPSPDELRLPVEPEPKPNLQSGSEVEGWGDDAAFPVELPEIGDFLDKLNKAENDTADRIEDLNEEIGELDDYTETIDNRLDFDDVPAEEKEELEEEKQAIEDVREELVKDRAESQSALKRMREEKAKLPSLGDLPSHSENPSLSRIPELMNQQQERYTQWVRSTQPYVDSFRAPILAMFKRHLKKSKAAERFEKWTNRYAMVKAWQFRSGYRIERTGNASATWRETEDALHMHVLKEAFDGEVTRKGSEPWTQSTDSGKRKAEEYFTLIGFAHRDFEPLFSSVVYPSASDQGNTCYAQAIFYNANKQQSSNGGETQAKLGWDTLNWDPESTVPEWAGPATESNAKWPWEIFSQAEQSVKVKLNWQAKLMPVTQSRLEDSEDELDGGMSNNVSHAIEYFDSLGTH